MNLFEDLIEELKEENLIEVNSSKAKASTESEKENSKQKTLSVTPSRSSEVSELQMNARENFGDTDSSASEAEPDLSEAKVYEVSPEETEDLRKVYENSENKFSGESFFQEQTDNYAGESFEAQRDFQVSESEILNQSAETESADHSPKIVEGDADKENDLEFLRRRASEEVSSLQIVEHILSGVEREQMKILPQTYNHLEVSKSLHEFLQLGGEVKSPEHYTAEYKLNQEIEKWHLVLLQRDKTIKVAHLRRYCETTRPALSPQALVSMARFYRNSPFSDEVREKFEMVITRLLTKDLGNDKRDILLDSDELVNRLNDLYVDWASIPVYSKDEEKAVAAAVLKFEEFAVEADKTATFEELIRNNFFKRLHNFKDTIGESFFSPLVTAASIESNVIIGNRYVDIINKERENNKADFLKEKYEFELDPIVSDSTSKTLQLVELLDTKKPQTDGRNVNTVKSRLGLPVKPVKEQATVYAVNQPERESNSNNKFILIAALLLASVAGFFLWSNHFSSSARNAAKVKRVELENSDLRYFFTSATVRDKTFFAVAQPDWETLAEETKQEVLQKTFAAGVKKGYDKVQVLNAEGKIVGSASADGIKYSEE